MSAAMKEVLLRVPVDQYDRIKQLADEGDRPIAAELRRAIRRHVENSTTSVEIITPTSFAG